MGWSWVVGWGSNASVAVIPGEELGSIRSQIFQYHLAMLGLPESRLGIARKGRSRCIGVPPGKCVDRP
jgi:hypothetical protein